MHHLTYTAVLVFVLLGSGWLEVAMRTRVYSRWRRLLLTLAPVACAFVVWDVAAVASGQWQFDPAQILGVLLPGGLPLEEVLFFLVVPIASILTLEAVRSAWRWQVGDEPDADRPEVAPR